MAKKQKPHNPSQNAPTQMDLRIRLALTKIDREADSETSEEFEKRVGRKDNG